MNKLLLIKLMSFGYYINFFVYPMISLIYITLSIMYFHNTILHSLLGVLLGVIIWGPAEYFFHRVAFHHLPLMKTGHGEHHIHPKWKLGTPFFASLPIVFLLTFLFSLLTGSVEALTIMAGFLFGYTYYMFVHHAIHNYRVTPSHWMYRYKRFHDIHHRNETVNFGITYFFWDRLFRTYQANH